ncbi:MAG: hypothetical protein ABIL09_17755 [Gemmatimonadota bacterium]
MKPRPAVICLAYLAAAALAAAVGCSDPDRRVTAVTADNAFELTLAAEKNWLHPGESLPVRLRLVSLAGQLSETARDTVEVVANNGTATPSRLLVTFVGRDDTVTVGAVDTYEDWLTFSVSPFVTAGRQGEIHALYRDVQATLKVRILE